jgi:hypothetical protein
MKEVELYISSLVESQLPSFYKEDGENFVAFIRAYFEWLEEQGADPNDIGNPTHAARNLTKYRDIDTTLDKFIENFQYKYLQGVPRQYLGDRRLLQKHIKEIYASKGTSRGLELLFRLLFNEDIEVYFPGDDVLKPSDGEFVKPFYLEMQFNPYLSSYVGRTIRGRRSGATAFVNDYRYFIKENNRFDILYLSNKRGNFISSEEIINEAVLEELEITVAQSPVIRGSLSEIVVIDGGIEFKVGDTFRVDGFKNGRDAIAVVTDVVQRAGFVTFDVRSGEYGFSNVATLETAGFDEVLFDTYMPQVILERTSTDLNTEDYDTDFTVGEIIEGNSSGARGLFVDEVSNTVNLSAVTGNFATGETITGLTSGSTRTFVGEDLVSEASFKIGELERTQTKLLSGIRIEQASNQSVTWTRSNTEIVVKHPFHCLRDLDEVVVKSSSDTNALPIGDSTVLLSDLDFTANSTGMFITVTDHGYNGGAEIIIRACSNTSLINAESTYNITKIDANSFSIPVTSVSSQTGTVNINDFYSIINPTATGNTSGTAIVEFAIDAPNYGGWADNAVRLLDTINESVANNTTRPTANSDIDQAIKFGLVQFGAIADERAVPSGLSSVFGGDGYRTNVLVEITDPMVYGLRTRGEGKLLTGRVSISGNTITGNGTLFSTELAVGREVYVNSFSPKVSVISAIANNTSASLESPFTDNANNTVDFTDVELRVATFWGRIDLPPTQSVDEADVYGIAGFGRGTVNRLAIADSGIGYQSGEQLQLYYTRNEERQISGYALAEGEGINQGFFKSTKGFLSSNKYIHDNKYYQEFSYEVQAGISFERYTSILKEIWHPAGVSRFGRVIVKDISELNTTSEIEISTT